MDGGPNRRNKAVSSSVFHDISSYVKLFKVSVYLRVLRLSYIRFGFVLALSVTYYFRCSSSLTIVIFK